MKSSTHSWVAMTSMRSSIHLATESTVAIPSERIPCTRNAPSVESADANTFHVFDMSGAGWPIDSAVYSAHEHSSPRVSSAASTAAAEIGNFDDAFIGAVFSKSPFTGSSCSRIQATAFGVVATISRSLARWPWHR
ncbi:MULTISPECIES: hypothetical protein [unclassified Rhodococcus (in: high G+C Gram-positive bacteria)]|uniref:hypothetical protein n=1 Tax=unclassified Rhodococcus (in: high G+C Gram-positive bacteria) TaxID=192944 RepID=UPI00114049DA|nr:MULTISPECIES: hypothetical protein [unclassified Rhodococcus (in: high G+C Gram-positive bacteria)]